MSIRPEVRAAPPYHFTARPYAVKLDQNESPYDLPPALKKRAVERLLELPFHRYPEMQAESLRAALADFYGWPEAGVLVSSGSNVLIQAIVAACGIGRRVLTVAPTFSVYSLQAHLLGAELTEVPLLEDFSLPVDSLLEEMERGEGVLFLANPAAPTGNFISEAQLVTLIERAAPRWTVVIDEAYHQFSRTDARALLKRYPHVLSLRTFSKAFGLGGVRLGYALAQPALAEQIGKLLLPFSVSALQTALGLTVLEDAGYLEPRIGEVEGERARVYEALSALRNVHVYPSVTNFLLFRVEDATAFYSGLLAQGVLIRRQDHLPGLTGCLRVSIGTPEENGAFLEAARRVAQERDAREQEVAHG